MWKPWYIYSGWPLNTGIYSKEEIINHQKNFEVFLESPITMILGSDPEKLLLGL
jgi:hypothetical protein